MVHMETTVKFENINEYQEDESLVPDEVQDEAKMLNRIGPKREKKLVQYQKMGLLQRLLSKA